MDTLGIIEVLVRIAWLAGAVAFVIGLARMNSPATARNGNLVSAGGMILAIVATAILILSRQMLAPESFGIRASGWALIAGGIIIGGGLGLYTARVVKMTAIAASARVTSRPPGIRIGLPGMRPWSLPDAMSDPLNVIEPMMMSSTMKTCSSRRTRPPPRRPR